MTVRKARATKVPITVTCAGQTATWSSSAVWPTLIQLGVPRCKDVRTGLPQTPSLAVGGVAVHLGRIGYQVFIKSGNPPLYPEVVPQQELW